MNYKKMLSLLLAASMTVSMPINVFATQPVTETENQTEVEPYIADVTAPTLSKISLSATEVNAGETLTVSIEGRDDISGIRSFSAYFENDDGRTISSDFSDFDENVMDAKIEVSEYEPSGEYRLTLIQVMDKAGNSRYYSIDPGGLEESLPNTLSFIVSNSGEREDVTAPTISKISLNATEVNAGETLTVSIEGRDDISGIRSFSAYFENDDGRTISSDFSDFDENVMDAKIEVSEYEPSGEYRLTLIQVMDKAGNSRYYSIDPGDYVEQLPNELSFTVINDDNIPTPTPDPTPSNPDKGTSSNSSSSSSSAVNYESEKPNPADKKAVEAYNFWQNAKAKVRTTPDGKTMRLFVPKDITYMPASMMETLYREKITLIITHNGKKIVIPAGKAMPKQKLKVYWTFESLEKLYQA